MTQRAITLAPEALSDGERAARRRLLGGAILAAALLGAFAGMIAGRTVL